MQDRLTEAQGLLNQIKLEYYLRICISQMCAELEVDGLRGDIVTNRASRALAAFEGRENVTLEDIRRIAPLCLRHRLRNDPLETIDSGDKVHNIMSYIFDGGRKTD